MDARESAVCRCIVGSLNQASAKHVEACVDGFEDRGSTPLASSLRSPSKRAREDCRAVAKGEGGPQTAWTLSSASYDSACQSSDSMAQFTYVYILQSEMEPDRFYTGCTRDLRDRLDRHNSGKVSHTAKWKPWRLKTYIAMSNEDRARDLERYLKTSSGRAFAKKRL